MEVSLKKPRISKLKEYGNYEMCIDGMMVMDGQMQKRLYIYITLLIIGLNFLILQVTKL